MVAVDISRKTAELLPAHVLYAEFTWLADTCRGRILLLLIKKVRALLLQAWRQEDRNTARFEMQLLSLNNRNGCLKITQWTS